MAKSQSHQTFEINNTLHTGYFSFEKYVKLLEVVQGMKKRIAR